MTIRICASLQPKTTTEAQALIKKAEELHVDFVEVRLDLLQRNVRLEDLTAHIKTPLIAADRSKRPEADRQNMLLSAAKSGFKYVDTELQSPKLQNFVNQAKTSGAKCIVSSHDIYKTPTLQELNRILEREVSSGADVCKIVTTAQTVEDNLTLLQFIKDAPIRKKPVCFAMGALGRVSRLLSPMFGSFFTFAALEHGSETAPGQMTVQEMRTAYELLEIK
ncbi:MAG TPA: type I 3-dehydroquinate dehydratase [Candidatus Nanoarchaeia archaeon]|nr:type I 3-dehydroquinate dehydratase [Candidatus Nanoarchaeia archaeon]